MKIVKVKYENTLRRLKVQDPHYSLTYDYLEGQIRELFQFPNTAKLAIAYTDEENDIVTMGNDDDVQDALVAINPLRLQVTLVSHPTSPPSSTPETGSAAGGKKSESEELEVALKRLRLKLASVPDSLKQIMQPYEKIFEGVTSASQMPDAWEACIQTLCVHFAAAISSISRSASAVSSSQVANQANATGTTSRPTSESVPVSSSLAENVGSAYVLPTNVCAPRESESLPSYQPKPGCFPDAPFFNENLIPPVVHGGITCDVCGAFPIRGTRWKSLKRHDYDLCSECFEKEEDICDYLRIDFPQFSRCPELNRMMRLPPYPLAHPIPQFDWSRPYDRLPGDPLGDFYSEAPFPFGGGPREKLTDAQFELDGIQKLMDAQFVLDGTHETEISPGVPLTKTYRVRNTGMYPWPVMTYLEHVAGSSFGQESKILLQEIPINGLAPEQETVVSIELTAPTIPGSHVSFWSLAMESGHRFGNPLSVQLLVRKETPEKEELAASTRGPFSRQSIRVVADLQSDEPQAAEIGVGSVSPSGAESDSEITSVEATDLEKIAAPKFDLRDFRFYVIDDPIEASKEEEREKEREVHFKTSVEVPQKGEEEIEKTSSASNVEERRNSYPVLDVVRDAGPVAYPTINTDEPAQPSLLESMIAESNTSGSNSKPDPETLNYPPIYDNSEPTQNIGDSMYFDSVMAVPPVPVEEVVPPSKALLARLEAMGFANFELNLELLEKNNMDLRSTLDDLCTVDEWEPFLGELEEMGFHDVAVNRRLMFKNRGNVKRVVKDLVQMYRDEQTKS